MHYLFFPRCNASFNNYVKYVYDFQKVIESIVQLGWLLWKRFIVKKIIKSLGCMFHQVWDHSGVWPKVSLVFEDFKFKISEG